MKNETWSAENEIMGLFDFSMFVFHYTVHQYKFTLVHVQSYSQLFCLEPTASQPRGQRLRFDP